MSYPCPHCPSPTCWGNCDAAPSFHPIEKDLSTETPPPSTQPWVLSSLKPHIYFKINGEDTLYRTLYHHEFGIRQRRVRAYHPQTMIPVHDTVLPSNTLVIVQTPEAREKLNEHD